MTIEPQGIEESTFNDAANAQAALREKLQDAMTPGFEAEFDPAEAEQAGAFIEDALSEDDARASVADFAAIELDGPTPDRLAAVVSVLRQADDGEG